MVKDLQYFLDEEDKFCKEHSNYGMSFFDESINELSFYGINDRLKYLSDKKISSTCKLVEKKLGKESKFGLSDAQIVILSLFHYTESHIFRDDYYNGITDFVQNLFDTLDDAINKAPINTDSKLYRFCNKYDKSDMKVGDIITFPHNLTCTNYDWKQEKYKNVYIITPLQDGKTRAHNVFEIFKHGDENQVDFLRNTKFEVLKIENTEGTDYKKFYLKEIANEQK